MRMKYLCYQCFLSTYIIVDIMLTLAIVHLMLRPCVEETNFISKNFSCKKSKTSHNLTSWSQVLWSMMQLFIRILSPLNYLKS